MTAATDGPMPDGTAAVDEGDVILAGVRGRIDALDDRLVDLLAESFAAVGEAARLKAPHGIPPLTPRRFQTVLARVTARAAARGLDTTLVQRLWTEIHDAALAHEAAVMAALRGGGEAG
jgi:chorismate mutase